MLKKAGKSKDWPKLWLSGDGKMTKVPYEKHPSGWYITDPEGLAKWQAQKMHRSNKPFQALCQPLVSRKKYHPDGKPIVDNYGCFSFELVRYMSWSVVQLRKPVGQVSNPFFYVTVDVSKDVILTHTSRADWKRIIPLKFCKSPARLALEAIGERNRSSSN